VVVPPPTDDEQHRHWLVCVATAHELRPLKRLLRLQRSGEDDSFPLFQGRAGLHRLSVLQTGIGPVRAQQAVDRFLKLQSCRGVISVGLSGGLRPDLPSGTLVMGDHWIRLGGIRLGDRLAGNRFDTVRAIGPPAGRRLRVAVLRAAEACGLTVHEGRLATADHLIGTPEEKRAVAARTDALAVDMESSSIAEAALAAGVNVVALRAILDPLDELLNVTPDSFLLADGSTSIWKSVLAAAARPMRLPALWDVGRRSSLAMGLLGRWLCRFWDDEPTDDGS
jgi:adenosylhomocysteine nucleosidase